MMSKIELLAGGVYQTKWSKEPVRILLFDQYEVMYDSYWSTLEKWTFALNRASTYYRILPSFFNNAELISVLPLDAKEITIYRPDLLLRVCRNKFLTWNENHFETLNEYNSHLSSNEVFYTSEIILPVTEIALQPFGPKGGAIKSTIIKSMDENGFTFNELLWHAHTIQRMHIREPERAGVGIYRSGHQKKIPSFYIGGYYDAANFLPKED